MLKKRCKSGCGVNASEHPSSPSFFVDGVFTHVHTYMYTYTYDVSVHLGMKYTPINSITAPALIKQSHTDSKIM